MYRRLRQNFNIIFKAERRILFRTVKNSKIYLCAPPSAKNKLQVLDRKERIFLCFLKKGSLTVEAAMIMPVFLSILLTFFSFFGEYATAAEHLLEASKEAKQVGVLLNNTEKGTDGDIIIYKSGQKAVCRAWVGFAGLETREVYVYITPNGSVYHLFYDCTHLKLSVRSVTRIQAENSKNSYGERYRKCSLCEEPEGLFVYITSEGTCYHSERSCSGLKRTVRQVPVSQVSDRSCCMRCMGRKEL